MEKSHTKQLNNRLKILAKSNYKNDGKCVLYVMSRDQRIKDNHSLITAQLQAIRLKLPLAVVFVLNTTKAQRAYEHYEYMINGLYELEVKLLNLNIPFIGLVGSQYDVLSATFFHLKPAAIYFDFNPLNGSQKLILKLAKKYPIIVVDNHNIVPVWVASDKQEIGARTLRTKINIKLSEYLTEPVTVQVHPVIWPNKSIVKLKDVVTIFQIQLKDIAKNNVKYSFKSGENAGLEALGEFIKSRFIDYAVNRNNPAISGLSNLSPYLHYGQLSSLRVVLECQNALNKNHNLQKDYDALVEEIVIRKELSDNYCYYNKNYKSLQGAPQWAQSTLKKHSKDAREFIYTLNQFENAKTHDETWNAVQKQLLSTGKIHGYMRMYWAKKVLEWSASPQEALNILFYLNDFYSLDGNDPNGYVGILWSVAGLHDRPWAERPVYGTVRSMVYNGLKRKFNVIEYINQNK